VAATDPEPARWRTDDELVMGPGESKAVGRGGWYSKIKLHLTRDGSRRHFEQSHEVGPIWGTSCSRPRRGAGSLRRSCCRRCGRVPAGMPTTGALLAAFLGLGVHVNLFPSAPGLYRFVTEPSTRGRGWQPA